MRITHGIVNKQIGDGIAELSLPAALVEALKGDAIHTALHVLRCNTCQNGLAREAHMQADQLAGSIKPADQLGRGDRMIAPMQHVFFTGPEQLHRNAGHLLGDQHGLGDIIMHRATAAKPATKMQLVDITFGNGQA